jgi:hypothetical protein
MIDKPRTSRGVRRPLARFFCLFLSGYFDGMAEIIREHWANSEESSAPMPKWLSAMSSSDGSSDVDRMAMLDALAWTRVVDSPPQCRRQLKAIEYLVRVHDLCADRRARAGICWSSRRLISFGDWPSRDLRYAVRKICDKVPKRTFDNGLLQDFRRVSHQSV